MPVTPRFNPDVAVSLALIVFAFGLPLNPGGSLLLGAGRNAELIFLRLMQPPLILLSIWIIIGTTANATLLPSAWQVGTVITAASVARYAERVTRCPIFSSIGLALMRKESNFSKIRKLAFPMFLISLGQPVAIQSDRIILNIRSDLTQVANYSIVSTIQTPLIALAASAGVSLWPYFAKKRSEDGVRSDFIVSAALFAVAGLAACVGLTAVGPFLVPLVSKGQALISVLVFASAGAVVLAQSLQIPPAMFLTDEKGLSTQSKCVLAMIIVNLVLSWLFSPHFGAAGPYLGTAVSVSLCQVVPTSFVSFRKLRLSKRAPLVQG
jgi:O-antigen/teichoic acid export membrane protein